MNITKFFLSILAILFGFGTCGCFDIFVMKHFGEEEEGDPEIVISVHVPKLRSKINTTQEATLSAFILVYFSFKL